LNQKRTKKSPSKRRRGKGKPNPLSSENKGKLEISQRKPNPNWSDADLERYLKAVTNSISKASAQEDGSVDITEVWVNSSLPLDLVLEAINHPDITLPDHVKSLKLYGKEIWKKAKEAL